MDVSRALALVLLFCWSVVLAILSCIFLISNFYTDILGLTAFDPWPLIISAGLSIGFTSIAVITFRELLKK